MKVLLFANTEWYLYNFRLSLARALRDAGHEVVLMSPPGPYGDRLIEAGFRWIAAPMDRGSLHPLKELALLFWLRRLILAERPEIVHGFTIKCAVYASLAARMAGRAGHSSGRVNAVAGMGYVFTSNDLKARALRPLVRGLMRLALDGSKARLIVQNPDDAAFFIGATMVDPARIRLIPGSGVDCRRFAPMPGLPAASNGRRLRVLMAARLLWDKGLAEFADAARLVRQRGHAVQFLLAGEPDPGNPAAVPEAAVRRWVDEGVLEWLGHIDDMPELLRSTDVAVLPSYREGLPKGLIEAAACGLPVVTTDVPGCREVVLDDVNGLLVPVRDSGALASAIIRLCEDDELRRRLGAAARSRAETDFDERIIIDHTIKVYQELL